MSAIKEEELQPDIRNEIVHDLVVRMTIVCYHE